MEESCDVYRRDHFLDGLILVDFKYAQSAIASDLRRYLEALGTKWLDFPSDKDLTDRLPPGPYLYLDKALKPVHRLYDDVQGAFLTALKPKTAW